MLRPILLSFALSLSLALVAPPRASAAPELLCDEPSAGACTPIDPEGPPPPLAPAPLLRRWQPRVSLAALSGVSAHASLFASSSGPTPYLGGELRVLWQKEGSRIGLGLRLAGSSTISGRGSLGWDGAHDGALRVLGFDAGFVFSAAWFWLSSGIGVMHVQDLRAVACRAGSCSERVRSDETLPDASLALGLDIPLGDHLALRLYGQAASLLVTLRVNAGGGLVVRF